MHATAWAAPSTSKHAWADKAYIRPYSGVLVLDTCRLPLLRQHPRFCTANWAAALVRENFFGARRANTALVWTYFAQSRLNVTLLWAERAHKWCWTGSSRFLHLHCLCNCETANMASWNTYLPWNDGHTGQTHVSSSDLQVQNWNSIEETEVHWSFAC